MPAGTAALAVDRAFVRIPAGRIHFRFAGNDTGAAPPLIVLHGGPGSSAGLEPLIAALAGDRRVIAPDMMGCGESDPPPSVSTEIGFYAECLRDVLDALGLDALGIGTVDLYGHHTGAQVGCEFAIANPKRVGRLVLDGAALFPLALREEFVSRYAPPLVPDEAGAHLEWVWAFASQLTRHFPHYRHDDASKIAPETILPPATLTDIAAEVLKNWATFHLTYQAAFRHDLRSRLPLVAGPTLVLETIGDPLACYVAEAVGLLPAARSVLTSRDSKASAIGAFLRE